MGSATTAERLKARRQGRGWTQEQLAVYAGITGKTVVNIEGGADCRLETMLALAKALECELSDLMDDAPEGIAA